MAVLEAAVAAAGPAPLAVRAAKARLVAAAKKFTNGVELPLRRKKVEDRPDVAAATSAQAIVRVVGQLVASVREGVSLIRDSVGYR